jgi:hypothetical protein
MKKIVGAGVLAAAALTSAWQAPEAEAIGIINRIKCVREFMGNGVSFSGDLWVACKNWDASIASLAGTGYQGSSGGVELTDSAGQRIGSVELVYDALATSAKFDGKTGITMDFYESVTLGFFDADGTWIGALYNEPDVTAQPKSYGYIWDGKARATLDADTAFGETQFWGDEVFGKDGTSAIHQVNYFNGDDRAALDFNTIGFDGKSIQSITRAFAVTNIVALQAYTDTLYGTAVNLTGFNGIKITTTKAFDVQAVPEPASFAVLGLAGLALAVRRRSRAVA